MRLLDSDRIRQQLRFRAPVTATYFLAGLALTRFHAYLLIFQPWAHALLYALWAVLGVLGAMTALSCWHRYEQGLPAIGEREGQIITVLLIVAIALGAGYGFESARF